MDHSLGMMPGKAVGMVRHTQNTTLVKQCLCHLQVAQGAVEKSAMRKLLSMALSPGTSDVLYEHVAGATVSYLIACNVLLACSLLAFCMLSRCVP